MRCSRTATSERSFLTTSGTRGRPRPFHACYHSCVTGEYEGDGNVVREISSAIASLGLSPVTVHPLAGDASTRRFFRVGLGEGKTLVAALYPPGSAVQAKRDAATQGWAVEAGLPVPQLIAAVDRIVLSADLGDEDLELALRSLRAGALEATRTCLAAFQATAWQDAPNPPFDEAFFRAELRGFEEDFVAERRSGSRQWTGFLDDLAGALTSHPYRLAHRDFHLNNLFWRNGAVAAVDFQDLRGAPDTYDVASLLYERAGRDVIPDPETWARQTAVVLGWSDGWRRRLLQCRAQRGLKVLGTFARLTRLKGVGTYAAWLPGVRMQTVAALLLLDAPLALRRLLEAPHPFEGL